MIKKFCTLFCILSTISHLHGAEAFYELKERLLLSASQITLNPNQPEEPKKQKMNSPASPGSIPLDAASNGEEKRRRKKKKEELTMDFCSLCNSNLVRTTTTVLFHFVTQHGKDVCKVDCPAKTCALAFKSSESLRKHITYRHKEPFFKKRKDFKGYCVTCKKTMPKSRLLDHQGHSLRLRLQSTEMLTELERSCIKESFLK